MNELKKKIVTF